MENKTLIDVSNAKELKEIINSLITHYNSESNPHSVTKSQVGLGNADNTADLDKPISKATQSALNARMVTTDYIQNGKLKDQYLPDFADNDIIECYIVSGSTTFSSGWLTKTSGGTALTPQSGKVYIVIESGTYTNKQYRYDANQEEYVPLTIDIGDLADKSYAVGDIDISLNNTTYVLSFQLKDVNGDNLGQAKTIDLPLESIVVSGTYYNSYTYDGTTYNKVIVIVLSTTNVPLIVPVGDLVSGLQSSITSSNKLSADLVDDTNATNKFVTAAEKSQISTNTSNITSLQTNKADKTYVDNKIQIANVTFQTSDWTTLTGNSDYNYYAAITLSQSFDTNDIVELINNDITLFNTYGFAIYSITSSVMTIYAKDVPTQAVTLYFEINKAVTTNIQFIGV